MVSQVIYKLDNFSKNKKLDDVDVEIISNNLFYNQKENTHIKMFEKKAIKVGVYLLGEINKVVELKINDKDVTVKLTGKKQYISTSISPSDDYSDNLQINIKSNNNIPITILGFHAQYAIKEANR